MHLSHIQLHAGHPGRLLHWVHVACRMRGMCGAALACFGIEFITLLMGVTIFMRFVTGLNIIAHLVGLILTILFYVDVSVVHCTAGLMVVARWPWACTQIMLKWRVAWNALHRTRLRLEQQEHHTALSCC